MGEFKSTEKIVELDNTKLQFYNQKVLQNKNLSARVQQQKRRNGPAYPLKVYHNTLKRELLNRYAGLRHLDLCCGRGGDLQKYQSLLEKQRLSHVSFIDQSSESLLEAQSRWNQQQLSLAKTFTCDFKNWDLSQVAPPTTTITTPSYDSASCMFALSYFFDRPASLHSLFQFVNSNLKEGGYFFGIYTRGESVLQYLQKNKNDDDEESTKKKGDGGGGREKILNLRLLPSSKEEFPFGQRIQLSLKDTIVEQQEPNKEEKEEYLVFDTLLLQKATEQGWQLVPYDDALRHSFLLLEKQSLFLPLKPNYAPNAHPDLSVASSLYSIFIFQKAQKQI